MTGRERVLATRPRCLLHEFELRIGLQLGLGLMQPQWPRETEERGKCLQRGVGARLSEEFMTA